MIKAKPIVKDRFYILRDGKKKIGEVSYTDGKFNLRVKNYTTEIKQISNLQEQFGIEIDNEIDPTIHDNIPPTTVYDYPAKGPIFDTMWDVHNKLPLYTRKENSKSLYAAGWYRLWIRNQEKVAFCPKLIILQRNQYQGPFESNPDKELHDKLFEHDTFK